MTYGELDRFHKLSETARTIIGTLARYAQSGQAEVSLNDLRYYFPNSATLLTGLNELNSRDYGRLDTSDRANPKFTMALPTIQSLVQDGLIVIR